MAQRLNYRGEIVTAPGEYVAGRFKVRLLKGETEIGLISGYAYLPDSFGTYGGVLAYTDEWDGDEYTIIDEMVRLVETELRKGPFARFISENMEDELFAIGMMTIDRVYILPEYRGQGYAKEALSRIKRVVIKLFGEGIPLVGLIAHAFEPDKSVKASDDKLDLEFVEYSDDETSTNRLVRLYESVGFRTVKELHGHGNAKVMVMEPQR